MLLIFPKMLEKMCLRIYQLGPAKFLSAPALAWQPVYDKNKELSYLNY